MIDIRIVVFCSKHGLTPSIKAGGYGTAGWAIGFYSSRLSIARQKGSSRCLGGDIIVDLSKLTDLDIEVSQDGSSYTSLRDMVPASGKGKRKAGIPAADYSAPGSGKRRRDDDARLRIYNAASPAVASFLDGPPLPPDPSERPRPFPQHRPAGSILNDPAKREPAADSDVSSPGSGDSQKSPSPSTHGTSPSPEPKHPRPTGDPFGYLGSVAPPDQVAGSSTQTRLSLSSRATGSDPFGYMNAGNSAFFTQPSNITFPALSTTRTFGATLFHNPSLPSSASLHPLTHTQPIHKHAYVSFGAGVRQKEVDTFTAANPIEGTSLSGPPGLIPYHVPL